MIPLNSRSMIWAFPTNSQDVTKLLLISFSLFVTPFWALSPLSMDQPSNLIPWRPVINSFISVHPRSTGIQCLKPSLPFGFFNRFLIWENQLFQMDILILIGSKVYFVSYRVRSIFFVFSVWFWGMFGLNKFSGT